MPSSETLRQVPEDMFAEIADWNGGRIVVSHHVPTGAWFFVAGKTKVDGLSGGGTRIRVYERPSDGLRDAMLLAGAMAQKFAITGLPVGGGKSVIAVPELPEGEVRQQVLSAYGELIRGLGSSWVTGPDMNVSVSDLEFLKQQGLKVFGTPVGVIEGRGISHSTAMGTFLGIKAALRHRTGSDSVTERRVVVQGLGSVGGPLARMLAEERAELLVCDIDQVRADQFGAELHAKVVDNAEAPYLTSDVYAPCAVGGTVRTEDVERLGAGIVAGSANNPLVEPRRTAEALRHRGILFAPDFVINSGGAQHAVGVESLGWTVAALDSALARIDTTLTEIWQFAEREQTSAQEAAERIAEQRLAEVPAAMGA